MKKKVIAINGWKWNMNTTEPSEDVHSMQHKFNLNRDAGLMYSLCSTSSKSHIVISHSSPFTSSISSRTVTLLDQSLSKIYSSSKGLIKEA